MALQAARVGARLVHGLHLEVPPGRLPAVVTVQDVVPLDHPASMPSRAKRAVYRDLLNRSLRRAERIIVPSPATADRLAALGAAPDRIDVIPLGIGPGFRPSSPAEREVARRRFASGRRYVVAATGAKAHKNLTGMGQAAAVLAPEIAVAATGRGNTVAREPLAVHRPAAQPIAVDRRRLHSWRAMVTKSADASREEVLSMVERDLRAGAVMTIWRPPRRRVIVERPTTQPGGAGPGSRGQRRPVGLGPRS